MNWDISMSFFISVIFWNIVQIIPSDNNCPLHFGRDDNTLQNFSPDGNFAGEGAFFINIF